MLMESATVIPLHEAEQQQHTAAVSKLPIFSARELGETQFPDIRFVVPGILPEGASILAGRPKLGKSWLALDMALAVAQGTDCLGVQCERGAVLYLALEDNQRRLQSRLDKLSPRYSGLSWPSALSLATEWKRCDEGGIDDVRAWAGSVDNPRLVIVDILQHFRSRGDGPDTYRSDVEAIRGLQELAGEMQLAVVIVHHVRKSAGEFDPFEKVSGTLGLTGSADTTMILDRGSNGCSLYARGRDLQEVEKAVTFDPITCRWNVQGDAAAVRRTDERAEILDVLLAADEPYAVKDIVSATGGKRNNIDQLLFSMGKAGEVLKAGRGKYVHADRRDLIPPNKIDKKIRNSPSDREDEG